MTPEPDPETARRLLQQELARSEYNQQSLLDRFWDWFTSVWDRLNAEAVGADHLTTFAVIAVTLVLLAALAVGLPRVRAERRGRRPVAGVLDADGLSADDLRRRAEAAASAGDHADAVADAVRALARRSVERALIDDAPGRTTHEVLASVGELYPGEVDRLDHVAGLFDAVVYGRHSATAADSGAALALEADLRRTRPSTATARSGLQVPR